MRDDQLQVSRRGVEVKKSDEAWAARKVERGDPFATLHWALVRLLVVAVYKPVAKPIFAWLDKRAEIKGEQQ